MKEVDTDFRICSAHRRKDPNCEMCKLDIREVFPDYEKKHAEAIAAGLHKCTNCNFEYYKTTDMCPLCSHLRKEE